MLLMQKRLVPTIAIFIGGLMAVLLFASPAAAAPGQCGLPLTVKLNSHDPTVMLEGGQAWVYVKPGQRVRGLKVEVKRGGKIYARGNISGRLPSGRTTVVRLSRLEVINRGRYKVVVSARRGGCSSHRSKVRGWSFAAPSLPVKALPYSTRVGDNLGVVRFALRPLRRASVGTVRTSLINSSGATVAEDVTPELGSDQVVAELPISNPLVPGQYTVRLLGKQGTSEILSRSDQQVRFVSGGGGAAPVDPTGMQVQKIRVDWSGSKWQGRQIAGFIAPGIGFGEVVCSPDQQWIRFYPSKGSRESAMMTWTDKDWGSFSEVALREAKYATGTGPDFREGFNKFGPTEKWSRGKFQGIISDRGPMEGPGGAALAPPTTYDLNWEWDFSKAGNSRCSVEAVFRTETDQSEKPLARSAQVVWRGETNATPANNTDTVNVPDLGDVTLTCEAGPTGVRRLNIDSPVGGRVETREGSDVAPVDFETGPIEALLPNNGMLFLHLNSGERFLVSSRWKVNDPVPERNWCVVSLQAYTP
jgi:hypothetical protein